MTCPHCGNDHNEFLAGRFCEHCGQSVGPPPKHDTDPDIKVQAEPVRCPECARPTAPDDPRCKSCGARLKGAPLP